MTQAPASFGATDSTRSEVLSVARQVAVIVRRVIPDPAYRVFLFGSWALGKARARSDIDVGIEGPSPVDPAAMLQIRDACDTLSTLFTVDVVDVARLAPTVRYLATSRVIGLEEG